MNATLLKRTTTLAVALTALLVLAGCNEPNPNPNRWANCNIIDMTLPSDPVIYSNVNIIAQGDKWVRFKANNLHANITGDFRVEYRVSEE